MLLLQPLRPPSTDRPTDRLTPSATTQMPLLPTRAGTSDGPHPQPHPQHNPSPSPSEVETCHRCRTPLPLFLLSACGLLLLLQLLLPAHAFIVPSTSCSSSSRIRAASTTRRHATTVPAPSSSAAASIIPASYTGPVYMEDAHKDTKAALPPPIKGKSAPVEDTSLKVTHALIDPTDFILSKTKSRSLSPVNVFNPNSPI